MRKLVSFSLLTIFALIFWACEKKGDPPALPPLESMSIDFSQFSGVKKSGNVLFDGKTMVAVENSNWITAVTVVGVWNTLITVNLAIPVTAFHIAMEKKPAYLDNKTWEWKYSVDVLGATYNARLTGQIRTTDIEWIMRVGKTGPGGFGEFVWFTGTTALDGKSGQWILNHSQQFQEPMLQIDWEKTGTEIGSIKYTYIRELADNRSAEPFKNSYLRHGLTSNTLNAFYEIHFYEPAGSKFVDVDIEWSTTQHNGRIMSPDYFQDTSWHCWDSNVNDTNCPPN